MPNLAKKLVLDSSVRPASLKIDGQEFPWLISDEGVTVKFKPDGTPVIVDLPLMADEVVVITADGEQYVYGDGDEAV